MTEKLILLDRLQPQLVKKAAFMGHYFWQEVMKKEIEATTQPGNRPVYDREKPLNFRNIYDIDTFLYLKLTGNPAVRTSADEKYQGKTVVDILDVKLNLIPDKQRKGTFKSVRIAADVIEKRFEQLKKVISEKNMQVDEAEIEILERMATDMIIIEDYFHRLQNGEQLSPDEKEIMTKNWVIEGAMKINDYWKKRYRDRTDLTSLDYLDGLDPYNQEKDYIYLKAVLLTRMAELNN